MMMSIAMRVLLLNVYPVFRGAFCLCTLLLFRSFIRVNVFLLLVYSERQKNTSYELMKSRVGGDIIRMYDMEDEGGDDHA